MTNVLIQMLQFMLSYAIILTIGYLLINFLSNGFFNVFIIVKISRGKKTLVKVVGIADSYYKAGKRRQSGSGNRRWADRRCVCLRLTGTGHAGRIEQTGHWRAVPWIHPGDDYD